jgi:hypothetical protein
MIKLNLPLIYHSNCIDQEVIEMLKIIRFTFFSILLLSIISNCVKREHSNPLDPSYNEKSKEGQLCNLPSNLVGRWEATEIEGAIDAGGNPLHIDGSVSTLEFFCDGKYTWFLHAPSMYNLDGGGDCSFSDNTLHFTGAIKNWLGISTINYSISNTDITFLDEDGDRWRYQKR